MPRKPKYPKYIDDEFDIVLGKLFGHPIPPATPILPPKEYIYLTKADCGYKIGRTTQPNKRPLSVAGNMPIKLSVIAVIEVPNSKDAERRLHWIFSDKRLRGEWFALTDEDVELVKGYPSSLENLPNSPEDEVPY